MNIVENKRAKILDSSNEIYDVSVCIITYNKEEFIEDTVNSVLMQKTTCSYEIVVGDNASTDKTREILQQYWEKDPTKFTIILNNENLGLTTNMYNTMRKAKGKYIVVLYGDDYWISENKIQSHFDFLETNGSVLAVSSAIESRYSGEDVGFYKFPVKKMCGEICTLKDFLNGYNFPMAGVMFRNEVFTRETAHFKKMLDASLTIDDLSFCILLLMKGAVYIIPEIMGVYRCFRADENANNFNSINSAQKMITMSIELLNNLEKLTCSELNLGMRYGLFLADYFHLFKKKVVSLLEYGELVEKLPIKYRYKHIYLLTRGILRNKEIYFSSKF